MNKENKKMEKASIDFISNRALAPAGNQETKTMGKIINDLCEMPDETYPAKNILFIPTTLRTNILTPSRNELLEFLYHQNPVTLKDIKELFGDTGVNDIFVLRQIGMVKIDEKEPTADSIVELNRNLITMPICD